ncbi:MAG: hypothetical protein H7315_14535 [Herminiimonas sp.]|nr:hypothetical protein [Herminiimonas sp.]
MKTLSSPIGDAAPGKYTRNQVASTGVVAMVFEKSAGRCTFTTIGTSFDYALAVISAKSSISF